MVQFDEETFLALSGLELGRYVDKLETAGFPELDVAHVTRLVDRCQSLDYQHAFHAIQFGIHFRVPNISDFAMRYLEREELSGGPIISMLRMLCDAHDLSLRHIRQLEKMRFDRQQVRAYDAVMQVFKEDVAILRRQVEEAEKRKRCDEGPERMSD